MCTPCACPLCQTTRSTVAVNSRKNPAGWGEPRHKPRCVRIRCVVISRQNQRPTADFLGIRSGGLTVLLSPQSVKLFSRVRARSQTYRRGRAASMTLTTGSTILADQQPSTRDLAPVRDRHTDADVLMEPNGTTYPEIYHSIHEACG